MTTKQKQKKERRLIVESLGGAKKIREGLREFSNRVGHMESQRAKLTEQYPDKWVAMSDGTIVATGDSLEVLLGTVDNLGISRVGLVIEYLSTKPRSMIL